MSDMEQKLDNTKTNESVHFARCNLNWFEENMAQPWEAVAWDAYGPTVLEVHRLIAKKKEVWYRVSFTKSDAIFEKRLEYPEGYDNDDSERVEVRN